MTCSEINIATTKRDEIVGEIYGRYSVFYYLGKKNQDDLFWGLSKSQSVLGSLLYGM
jgi:hypothetical protein